jgi:acyl-CoA synthetase (AMP-forming)/AMP-acid ligase II
MPGPLFHNGPIVWSCGALLAGNHVVVLTRFDAEATLAAIEHHGADIVYLVPTMMRRIWRLPPGVRDSYDLSTLRVVWHLAEPCPTWLKQAWIDWLGADRIIELYGGTEAQAATIITGREWLDHPGSVGRPTAGAMSVCDPDGVEVPPGTEGEIWMRSTARAPTYRYVGATPRTRPGGWESLGDVGWMDEDGYLYLGDRLSDMVVTGGANVYPAEVESAIQEHPSVRSCAVIGLSDDDLWSADPCHRRGRPRRAGPGRSADLPGRAARALQGAPERRDGGGPAARRRRQGAPQRAARRADRSDRRTKGPRRALTDRITSPWPAATPHGRRRPRRLPPGPGRGAGVAPLTRVRTAPPG